MTTEQQTSTTVSLTTATTQAPVTTVSSNTPVSGSEISFGGDTVPSNSLTDTHASATHSGFLVPVSATDQEPSGVAALQTNSTNVLEAQSSAFSVSNLPLPSPGSQVTMEQLQSVLTWLQQASANFIQRPNASQCVTQHESVSQTTRHDIPTSQIDTTAHLAHTSVQSRATPFSPQYSAPDSATTTNTPSSHVPLPTPGLHAFHTPTAQGFQQRTGVTAPSTGCGLYNLKQSLVLKLNKPDGNHLPTWFENAESRFLSAGVSTEEDRFNLFRDALSDEQANVGGKFASDAARTHSPYTLVKNALIKRYERRAHHRIVRNS